jgi:KDO2-lipid IV(A) lauroyltransferase
MRSKLEERGITPISRDFFSLQAAVDALRRGELLGLMVDQNAAVGGRFVPFFGTPASTMRGVAYFRELTGAAVICVHDFRENGRHRVEISEPIDLPDDEELALTMVNRQFEDVIRRHKDHYFWLHPRWKKRPEGEETLYPGLQI